MSWLSKTVKKVYNALTDSRSSLGKVAKYAVPFNAPYLVRDVWRKTGKKAVNKYLFGSPTSASGLAGSGYNGGYSSVYGPTGSIVGKY